MEAPDLKGSFVAGIVAAAIVGALIALAFVVIWNWLF